MVGIEMRLTETVITNMQHNVNAHNLECDLACNLSMKKNQMTEQINCFSRILVKQ